MVSQSKVSPLNANSPRMRKTNRARLLNRVCALALLAGASFYVQPAVALTTGFDDLTDTSAGFGGTPIANGYQGLNWTNWSVLNTADAAAIFGPSGATPGTVSTPNVAYNADGQEAIFSSTTPFNLNSAYLTSVWNDNLQVTITGKLNGVTKDVATFTLSATLATLETFNFGDINEVDLLVTVAGTPHSGYSGAGTQVALDNLTISAVPLPAALPLFATGLGTLGLLGWRRKRKAKGAIPHAVA
jgi:hypothetical protein